MMNKFLYDTFLRLYVFAVRIVSVWNPKAKKWIVGRRRIFEEIKSEVRSLKSEAGSKKLEVVWMHCASLGEFEQGRPLIEELKSKNENLKIVLTFFSPSGYEVMKNYRVADHVFYLPMDSSTNAKKFIDAINPSLVIWVKYEFWFYYLDELKRRAVPVILVSGIFRNSQPFFKWYGGIWKKMLKCFTHFFVQNESSKKLLNSLQISENVTLTGDTRFDRVIDIASNFEPVPFIENFCGNHRVIVAGSTWEEDEIELLHYIKVHPEIKFIIAPHEIDDDNLNEIKKELPDAIFYSSFSSSMPYRENVLIIDNVGMLSRLYHYATITYVGGGFGSDGVHNVLEAAVYGKPVVFGPEYEKFSEAVGLIEAGGGISFSLPLGLEKIFTDLFNDENELKKTGEAARDFVYSHKGATNKIINYIQEKRLLTN